MSAKGRLQINVAELFTTILLPKNDMQKKIVTKKQSINIFLNPQNSKKNNLLKKIQNTHANQ